MSTVSLEKLKFINDATKKILLDSKISTSDINALDNSLGYYLVGASTPKSVFDQLVNAVGSKDLAFDIFPYIIGCLEKSDKKTNLNAFFQQQAN